MSNKRAVYLLFATTCVIASCGSSGKSTPQEATVAVTNPRATTSTNPGNDNFIRATGVWELATRDLPESTLFSDATPVGEDVIAASVTNDAGDVDCFELYEGGLKNVNTATLEVRRFEETAFSEIFTLSLAKGNVSDLKLADVTEDGIAEILITTYCSGSNYDTSLITAFRIALDKNALTELPSTGASSMDEGGLRSFSKDCTPSCADGGVEYFRIGWNGSSFEQRGLITDSGTPVDLNLTDSCPRFKLKKRLPLEVCDRGPLVTKFLSLARSAVGDYSEESAVSSAGDRVTPTIGRWIKTFRYRHGLEIKADIDEGLFRALGSVWYPEPDSNDVSLFESHCLEYGGEDGLQCTSRRYFFPSNECPEHRPDYSQSLPLRKCDVGFWVYQLKSALTDFDGVDTSDSEELPLFDVQLEARVRAYQSARGLEVDGLVGSNTWRALFGSIQSDMGYLDLNEDGMWSPGDIFGE